MSKDLKIRIAIMSVILFAFVTFMVWNEKNIIKSNYSSDNIDEIKISFDDEIWAGGKSSKATDRELAKHEPSICWRMDHLIFRVNSHLKGEFTADERYDYYRTQEKQDDPAAIAKVLELTKEMAKKFESWDTVSVIK